MMQRNIMKAVLVMIIVSGITSCSKKIYTETGTNAIKISAVSTENPIFKRMEANAYLRMEINIPAGNSEIAYKAISGFVNKEALKDIAKLEVYQSKEKPDFTSAKLIGSTVPSGNKFTIPLDVKLKPGTHYLWLSVSLKNDANIDHKLGLKADFFTDLSGLAYRINQHKHIAKPFGIALRKPKDENVHTYRIPGIVTTDKGTLISVYDIRYDHSGDLPANIDVGMSRSIDGGKTWDSMKTIMDMGRADENSGVGDPSVLFDPVTKTIWVSALWSKGSRSIAGSGPGVSPEETGQFVVTSSTDDGLTWSKPYSITSQVKNPGWRLFFPGPGNGIAMADGKIVFPAQYWDALKMPHSTLIYSDDHGKTWKSGIGAKSNTTESQLVETTPGTIMLNMRDNRGSFRSIATTTDMGKSWTAHSTSYHTLADPVCMGSFIKAKVKVKGVLKDVLFFSNPNVSKAPRRDITIKASLDMGETWVPAHQLLIDERDSFGYSALTKIDDNTIGILYEGISSLLFVRVPVSDIIK
jgi:sialidase-1